MTATTAAPARVRPEPVEADGDWYTHPATGERFLRVTSGLEAVPKEKLLPWAAGLTAKAAFAELPRVVAASRTRPCGRSYNRCDHPFDEPCPGCPCGDCLECVTKALRNQHWVEKKRRANEGSRVHHAIREWLLSDGRWPAIDDDIRGYIGSFRRWVTDYGLTPESWEMAEATVINRADAWGGTLDAQIRIRWGVTEAANDFCARLGFVGHDVLVTKDTKTREKEDGLIFQEVSLQVAAYRRGEVILLRDGTEEPLPPTDGGAVLQLRPGTDSDSSEEDAGAGYTFRPVVTDDHAYATFLGALGTYRWFLEQGTASVSSRTFPLPEDYKRDKANRRARERRAAARAAEPTKATPAARRAATPAPKTTNATARPGRSLPARVLGTPPGALAASDGALTDDDIPF